MDGYFRYAVRLWPVFFVGVVIDLLAWGLAAVSHSSMTGPPASILGVLCLALNPASLPTPEMYSPTFSRLDPGLSSDIETYAERSGVSPLPVKVLTGSYGKKTLNAWLKDKTIFVTERALREGSEGEIRYMLAHELAHWIRLEEHRKKVAPGGKGLVWPLILILTLVVPTLAWVKVAGNPWLHFGPAVIVGTLLIILTTRNKVPSYSTPELELWCDRKAVELTGDAESAMSMIQKVNAGTKEKSPKLSGYPKTAERIENIRSMTRGQEIVER